MNVSAFRVRPSTAEEPWWGCKVPLQMWHVGWLTKQCCQALWDTCSASPEARLKVRGSENRKRWTLADVDCPYIWQFSFTPACCFYLQDQIFLLQSLFYSNNAHDGFLLKTDGAEICKMSDTHGYDPLHCHSGAFKCQSRLTWWQGLKKVAGVLWGDCTRSQWLFSTTVTFTHS